MNRTICRTVGDYTHIANVVTSEIMTFKNLTQEDITEMETISRGDSDGSLDIDQEVRELFTIQGQANAWKCRPHFVTLGIEFAFPVLVNIELNRRCLLRCVHCYIGKDEVTSKELNLFDQMTRLNIRDLLSSLKDMGVFCLVFTGGEPLLNKNAHNFIAIASELGFLVEFLSSLQFLPEWLLNLNSEDTMIGRFQTSVYSNNPKTHDLITGRRGSWEKTLKNLLLLRDFGYCVEVATPLMTINYNDWRTTRDYFENIGIRQGFSWPILSQYYGGCRQTSLLNIGSEKFHDFVSQNPDFLIYSDLSSEGPMCAMARAVFCIAATGDIFPCSQLPISVGNIGTKDIKEIFLSNEMKYFSKLKKSDIGLKGVYNFCPGQNYTETGSLLTQPRLVRDVTYLLNLH